MAIEPVIYVIAAGVFIYLIHNMSPAKHWVQALTWIGLSALAAEMYPFFIFCLFIFIFSLFEVE